MGLFKLEWPSWLRGSTPLPVAPKDVQIGGELPFSFVPRINTQFPDWEDEVYNLNQSAYKLMRRCPAVIQPVKKLGERVAALDLVVEGPTERAAAILKILKQAWCLPDAIKFLVWGFIEGVVFIQMTKSATREGPDTFIVPDFMGGARHKWKAGGTYAWDWEKLAKIQDDNTITATNDVIKSQEVRIEDHIIFRPGIGSSPEGDLDLAYAILRLAERYELISKNIDAYADRHGLPREIIKKEMNQVAAANASAVRNAAARTVANFTPGQVAGLSIKEALEYLEPSGTSADFLLESLTAVYGEIHRLILNQDLTSSTKESGASGSSKVHKQEEDIVVKTTARQIAECFNRCLLPWILKNNPEIPELPEGEDECWLEFVLEEAEVEEDSDEAEVDGEDDEVEDVVAAPQEEKMMMETTQRLASGLIHHGCRCEINNGVWETAGDSSVCAQCIMAEISHSTGGSLSPDVMAAIDGVLSNRLKPKKKA